MRWDHDLAKMVVDRTLDGEKDGDSPDTLSTFVETGLMDCVAKGATEYFLVFSSHGSGFNGFGGDERRGDHRLAFPQTNQSILNALKTALANIVGAPDMFDVIGFDACLMQAIGAADECREVTKCLLASEAVEPGHGEWLSCAMHCAISAIEKTKTLPFYLTDDFQDGHAMPWPTWPAPWISPRASLPLSCLRHRARGIIRLPRPWPLWT